MSAPLELGRGGPFDRLQRVAGVERLSRLVPLLVAVTWGPLLPLALLFFAYVLIGSILAFAPLLVLVPQLLRARIAGVRNYGGLVSDYTRRFQARWIDSKEGRDDLLGTADLQALADLGTSYRENIEKMSVFLFGARDCLVLFVASFIPAVPLLFLLAPAHEVIRRLLGLLVGTPSV